MSTARYIASRVAVHEACHAVANYILGREMHSAEMSDNEGIVRVVPTDDPFDAIVSLLAHTSARRCSASSRPETPATRTR